MRLWIFFLFFIYSYWKEEGVSIWNASTTMEFSQEQQSLCLYGLEPYGKCYKTVYIYIYI